MKQIRILYFIKGPMPNTKQEAEAASMHAHVMFRNALHIGEDSRLEECDGVAGEIPASYSKLPSFNEAIAKRDEEIAAMKARANDDASAKPAPIAPAPSDQKPAKVWGSNQGA